ncbi:hypothetical protein AYX19_17780 [Paenarthrobacter ureafaciens]|nr:hypothetical protein AYX19_17780 [Paenarthrobacter ureafaciens]
MGKRRGAHKKVDVPPGGWQNAVKGKAPVIPNAVEPPEKLARVLDLEHEDVRSRRLVWRFSEVDRDGDWDPTAIQPGHFENLLQKMADFESMTIGEIFKPGSEHGKRYPVERLPSHTQARLAEIERDDETELARLRCGGAPRLYGFLRDHVFHVLWWDPKHAVFPSLKKHT